MRFFLVDRVDELVPGKSITGVKAVTLTDEIMHDHFPGQPLFPGTLMLEALAQLGGFLVDVSHQGDPDQRAVLAQIDRARFSHPARPGDVLSLRCELSSVLGGAAQVEGRMTLGEQKVASALLTFVMKNVESTRIHEQRRELYSLWTRHLQLGFAIR